VTRPNSKQQTENSKQQTANSKQRASDERRTTNDERRTTNDDDARRVRVQIFSSSLVNGFKHNEIIAKHSYTFMWFFFLIAVIAAIIAVVLAQRDVNDREDERQRIRNGEVVDYCPDDAYQPPHHHHHHC
jgi:hypothetical protein